MPPPNSPARTHMRPSSSAWPRLFGAAFFGALLAGCGGSPADPAAPSAALRFGDFPTAAVVLGQSGADGAVDTHLNVPMGNPGVTQEGSLFVLSAGNARMSAYRNYASGSRAAADLVVGMAFKRDISVRGSMLAIAGQNSVQIHDRPPAGSNDSYLPDAVAGGAPGCAATSMSAPRGSYITPDGKLVVADTDNHRVLIWNRVLNGGQIGAADVVIGQPHMEHCVANDDDEDGTPDPSPTARTLHDPVSVWSDGKRLVVADMSNHRLLIWNQLPSSNFQPADHVIGQTEFSGAAANSGLPSASASTLSRPLGVDVNEFGQVAVADRDNHRVLLWDSFPNSNGKLADQVIGQQDFSQNGASATPSARTVRFPAGVRFDGRNLLVVDQGNNRMLVWRALD